MPFVPVPFAAPTYNTQQSADRVIDLMLRQGDVAAQGARAQGGIWGNAVQNLGGQAAHYLDQRQQQQDQAQKSQAINQVLTSWDGTDSLDLMKKLATIPGIPPDAAIKIANGTTGMVKVSQAPEKTDWEAFHHITGGIAETLDQAGPDGIAPHWGGIKSVMDPYVQKLIGRPLGDQPNPEDIALIHGYDQRFNKQAKPDDAKPGSEAWYLSLKFPDGKPTPEQALQAHEEYAGVGKTEKTGTLDEQIAAAQLAGDSAKVKLLLGTKQQIASAGRDPNVAAAAASEKERSRSDRSYQYNTSELERLAKPVADQVENYSKFSSAIDQKTKEGDALAAPALLKVMIGGQGSGVRITKSEIDQVLGGRGKADDLQAFLQKWSSDSGAIPDRQRAQMKALADDVYKRVANKADLISKARRDLANAPDVSGHRKVMNDLQDQLGKMETAGGPKIGDVEDGYRFKGGDPKQQSSWEPVAK